MKNIVFNNISQARKKVFAGIPVYDFDSHEAIVFINARMQKAQKTLLMFANSNFVLKCQEIKAQLNAEPVIVVNDGISIDAASKIMYGRQFKENLNGTDFVPKLLSNLTANKKIVLLGSKPNIANLAGQYIEKNFGSKVVGSFNGFDDMRDNESLIRQINNLKPDIVLVGIGNPLQESWMLRNQSNLDVTLIVGVGALFDFISGSIKRAPLWVRQVRLEWLYRLNKEPRRLFKRYTLDVMTFFYLCIIDRLKGR